MKHLVNFNDLKVGDFFFLDGDDCEILMKIIELKLKEPDSWGNDIYTAISVDGENVGDVWQIIPDTMVEVADGYRSMKDFLIE